MKNSAVSLLAAGLLIPFFGELPAATAQIAPPGGADELQLASGGDGVAALEMPVKAPDAGSNKMLCRSLTDDGGAQELGSWDTQTFTQVAVTWQGRAGELDVRTRSNGRWTPWQELEPLGDGPDGPEATDRRGSELLWVGESDGVQLRTHGATPRDLELVLQHPGETPRNVTPSATAPGTQAATVVPAVQVNAAAPDEGPDIETVAKRTKVPQPKALHKRGTWKPNNKWRNGKPTYNNSLVQVHVHHTASSNSYSRADVPGIIRGMYRYHTKSLGWFDIGYNFLVDKFGGMWVGRSGGRNKMVRGAHTLGFNHNSTGIAVIGNFQSAKPTKKMLNKIARIAAWKLDKHGAPKARGKVKVTSTGSDRFRSGATVRLPAIDGHRDTNQTACPGEHLYKRLPYVRKKAQKRLNRFRN